MFRDDRQRQVRMLLQSRIEGFVNRYRRAPMSAGRLVVVSKGFENFSKAWRAREAFELAPPRQTLQGQPPRRNHACAQKRGAGAGAGAITP